MDSVVSVTLGPRYLPNMWDLRKAIAWMRRDKAPLAFVDVSTPITGQPIRLALRTADLYLIGIRSAAHGWWEFEPDIVRSDPAATVPPAPLLPGSRWIRAGSGKALSSYTALRLREMILGAKPGHRPNCYAKRPLDLIAFFTAWNGELNDNHARLHVCVVIFIICEALRFRSIENAACDWVSLTPRRPAGEWPVFEITLDMLERARSWRQLARSGHPDVQTWLADMPDPVVQ